MKILIRALGFYNAIINGLFIAIGVFMLLSRGDVAGSLRGFPGMAPNTVGTITSIMTVTGLAIVVIFGLSLIFTILVLVNSFRRPAQSKAATSTTTTQSKTN